MLESIRAIAWPAATSLSGKRKQQPTLPLPGKFLPAYVYPRNKTTLPLYDEVSFPKSAEKASLSAVDDDDPNLDPYIQAWLEEIYFCGGRHNTTQPSTQQTNPFLYSTSPGWPR